MCNNNYITCLFDNTESRDKHKYNPIESNFNYGLSCFVGNSEGFLEKKF